MTQQNGTGRRRGGGSARARPDLVVPGERREPEEGVELRARGSMEDVGAAVTVVPETGEIVGGGGDVRPVGTISGGRKKSAGGAGRVSVNFRMDPAVHFAMKLLVFETGLDQQYLINLAIRELCKEHGLDPDVIREGKGYTVSFPGSVGESG